MTCWCGVDGDYYAEVKMNPDSRPSESAQGVAAIRFAATLESDSNMRFSDPFARFFLNLKYRLLAGPLRKVSRHLYSHILPGVYETVLVRTELLDAILMESIKAGLEQFVLLGAGYDTRAYRFKDELEKNNIAVFELDHPSTQKRKLDALPRDLRRDSVIHVPIDFTKRKTDQALFEFGYDPGKLTLFFWEGVSMYLSEEAVCLILEAVSSMSIPGSCLVFDLFVRSFIDGSSRDPIAEKFRQFAAKNGEPLSWGIEIEELPLFLQSRGLKLLDSWNVQELLEVYQVKSSSRMPKQMLASEHIVKVAVV